MEMVEKGHMGGNLWPQTQVNHIFKALIYLTCKQNIIIYFPDFQISAASLTSLDSYRLKSGKISINWVSVAILETLR